MKIKGLIEKAILYIIKNQIPQYRTGKKVISLKTAGQPVVIQAPAFDFEKILEINSRILKKDIDFDYLLDLSVKGDKLVSALANSYINHFFAKTMLNIIFNRSNVSQLSKRDDDLFKYIEYKLPADLKLKLVGNLKLQKELLALFSKNIAGRNWGHGIPGKAAATKNIVKMLSKSPKRTINNIHEKMRLITDVFKKSIPRHIEYIFSEDVKNEELDLLIMELRRNEIHGKTWVSKRMIDGDNLILKILDSRFFNAYNTIYKVKTSTIH